MGTPKTPQDEVVGFHFQEIPLDEAVNAVIAGDGNYAVVKAKLLEALPSLPEGKAFAFGLPNGKEVEEKKRRGICMALNVTLKRAKLPWRVTYSGVKKLFVCVPPSTPRTYRKSDSPAKEESTAHGLSVQEIERAACKVFDIAPGLLRGQHLDHNVSKIRKAIIFLAVRRHGEEFENVRKHFGLSLSNVYGINSDAKKIPDIIKRLQAAL